MSEIQQLCGARLQACRVDNLVDVQERENHIDTTVDAARLEARATTETLALYVHFAVAEIQA